MEEEERARENKERRTLGPATQPWSKSESKTYRRKEEIPEVKGSLINLS